jgi:hypothetical protein
MVYITKQWAHPRLRRGPGYTGFRFAPFFAPDGTKNAPRPSYPLRVPKSGIPAGFWHRSFALQNSIYPPLADSNGNNGIHAVL